MASLTGNKPNQCPTNGDLGTLAFQDANAVNITGGIVDVSAGTAALPTLGTTGDPDTGVFFPAANTIAASTNGVERMRIDSSGNVGIGLTPTARNNTRLQIVDGIGFPATQSASTDVNTLDDYEEGTWTVSDSSGAGLTFTNTSGIYTKVGRLVICNVIFQYPVTVDSSQARISLPFTASNVTNAGGGVFNYNTPAGLSDAQPVAVGNQAYFLLANVTAGTAYLNSAASGTYFRGTISYFV